jgi:hypothetical protein
MNEETFIKAILRKALRREINGLNYKPVRALLPDGRAELVDTIISTLAADYRERDHGTNREAIIAAEREAAALEDILTLAFLESFAMDIKRRRGYRELFGQCFEPRMVEPASPAHADVYDLEEDQPIEEAKAALHRFINRKHARGGDHHVDA